MNEHTFSIKPATVDDAGTILSFIKELADYEKLTHEVVATEELLHETLFGERQVAEILLGHCDDEPAGFALFFHNFSTFLGRPGIYLEDLYVKPEFRGNGLGRRLLQHIAALAKERQCGRVEWSVLDWNEPSIQFYRSLEARPLDEWTMFRLTGGALERMATETSS